MTNATKGIVLVDMDGAIAKWDEHFERVYRDKFPGFEPVPSSERTSFGLRLPGREWEHDFIQPILDHPGFYKDLEPMEHSVEALHEMRDDGWDVVICSSPTVTNPTCASDKYNWLIEHYGLWVAQSAILTTDKTLVFGDYLFDDKPSVTGRNPNPSWKHIYVDAPYNAMLQRPRITDWRNWRVGIEKADALSHAA